MHFCCTLAKDTATSESSPKVRFELEINPTEKAGNKTTPATSSIQAKVAGNVDVAPLLANFTGGPGAGKGTQCAKIVEKYGLTHLSTGELLRAEVNSGSPRGAELNKIMQNGDLVPLDVVLGLLKEAISRATINGSNGFLIDGYPREIKQGDCFEAEVQAPNLVFYLEVSQDTLVKRCLKRAQTRLSRFLSLTKFSSALTVLLSDLYFEV
ncbi:unnamed protein product [Gongylonema pulchrum]|uniref:Adenylate kinase n=1 Tax=Gongylonema pulchrum TaxID=637853 RepID=A0A183DSP8_9BILA|nr:unnamed protein product [Gongylonema pulchrum]